MNSKLRFFERSLVTFITVGVSAFVLSACSPEKSGLQVLSSDVPSSVYLDAKYLDHTPYINKDLKPAEYSLEVRPDDPSFVPYQTKLSLKKGVLTVVDWKPGKRPETSGGVIFETEALRDKKASELSITTIPDGGIIYVDGEAKGFAPVTVTNLSKGEHQFEVKLPSYEAIAKPINILEGYRLLVTVKLGKQEYQGLAPAQTVLSTEFSSNSASNSSTATSSGLVKGASSSAIISATDASTRSASTKLVGTKVVILPTGYTEDGNELLRVRAEPNSGSREIGKANVGGTYTYLQEVRDGWVKIQFGPKVGWVSLQYVKVLP